MVILYSPIKTYAGETLLERCGSSGRLCFGVRMSNWGIHKTRFWISTLVFGKKSHSDFEAISVHLDPNKQRSISAFETLAQIALVWLVATSFPGFRIPVCLRSLSDNTGAESVSNKLFTTSYPLCLFVEISPA